MIQNKFMVFLVKLYKNCFFSYQKSIIEIGLLWSKLFEKMYEESKDQIQREYILNYHYVYKLAT